MQIHIFKNIVTAFLVMLFVFSPVLEVKKASAQAGGGYPTTGSYSYGSGGTSGGNSGGPAFVQDPGRFLRDIAKEEVLTFGLQLNLNADCQAVFSGNVLGTTGSTNIESTSDCLNPYGKSWFKYQAEAFNKKFNDNARYSLNELIAETTPQYTGASFRADFSAGGWNAWTALTTVPANNPVGFGILAETELSKRLAGTQKSTAEQVQDALKESNGFLGDYRCADPEGTTKDQ